MNSGPLGVFDSGIGGLSVLREILRQQPHEDVIYIADQSHVPYGPRPISEVERFSEQITRFLRSKDAKLIVVACNTASAAALYHLRELFPDTPFVGMEPAVKPAAEKTQSGVVGVLATPATFQGELYASVIERFAHDVIVLQDTCPGLITRIENGELQARATKRILEKALRPMLARGVDRIVMGCTHYPFVIPLIREIVGPGVEVIDPAPAVARQVGRLLDAHEMHNGGQKRGKIRFYTTGDPVKLESLLPALAGVQARVEPLRWQGGKLVEAHRRSNG